MTPQACKMKVLAVDDNRTNLHILQVFLKKLGHDVILAENGEEAVECFVNDAPDLILLDIMMPVMDGFEAARRIKAISRERWTPIIFLSALNRDENLVEGLDAGADDYLTKPINFVVLEAKLRSMQRSLAMQQASIESLRRVQTISDNVADAIVTIDQQGLVASANRSAERMFGLPNAEMLGQDIRTLIPGLALDVSGSGSGQEREVEAEHRDGRRFAATISITEIDLDNKRMSIGVIRDISERKQAERKLRENARLLQAYFDQTQSEQQLAMRLMEKQLHRPGLKDERLHYKVIPAENFSGDIVAAARSPEGRFYALLADATGHGLPAAISVLPVLALFYRMTKLNRAVAEIVQELNQQLKESMPIGRFVAATLLCLDESRRQGEIWVGGTPQAFMFDRWGRITRTFPSENLALGIVDNREIECRPVEFIWEKETQLLLCSDGLLEAANKDGAQFGVMGLAAAAANTSPANRFQQIDAALVQHLDGSVATDDVSLMVIDCP
jgi:PAS domain S-box-containing protein